MNYFPGCAACARFGKSTHISMISNSVTHLRSYTNYAIADIAGNSTTISPVTPRDRQVPTSPHRAQTSSHQMTSVSWCFTSGSQCFTMYHNVSQCFTCVSWCFTMFNNVLWCLASRATIGDNSAEIRGGAEGMMDRRYRRDRDHMLNSVLSGDRSNSVPERNIPEDACANLSIGLLPYGDFLFTRLKLYFTVCGNML